jgi:hypothetical protein
MLAGLARCRMFGHIEMNDPSVTANNVNIFNADGILAKDSGATSDEVRLRIAALKLRPTPVQTKSHPFWGALGGNFSLTHRQKTFRLAQR